MCNNNNNNKNSREALNTWTTRASRAHTNCAATELSMVERALGASTARGGKVTRTTLRRSSHQRRRGAAAAAAAATAVCSMVGRCEENDLGAVCDWWPGQLPAATNSVTTTENVKRPDNKTGWLTCQIENHDLPWRTL